MPSLRPWLHSLALLLGTVAIWQLHVVRTATIYPSFPGGDPFGYFLPAYDFLGERLRHGAVALWNPWQGAGVPLLAALQPGALYPPRLLLAVLRPETAMAAMTLGHVMLAVLSMDRLCLRLGASAFGATVGAMAFGASTALPATSNPAQLEPLTWLPLAALALLALVESARWRWAVALGIAAAMPFLAGGYQIAVYVAYGLVLLALALLVDRRWRPRLLRARVLLQLGAAGILAASMAAPQALPTLDWSQMTSRPPAGMTDEQIFPRFLSLVNVFHIQTTRGLVARTVNADFARVYLSVPVVVLALVGFVRSGGLGIGIGLGALFAYMLMLGPGTPWFVVYRWLPGMGMFRFPLRLWTLLSFGMSLGAALGTTRLAAARLPSPWRSAIGAAAVAIVFAIVVWPQQNQYHYPWTHPPFIEWPLVAKAARIAGTDRAWLPGDRFDLGLGEYPRQGTRHRLRVLQDYEPLSSRRLGAFLAAVVDKPFPDPDIAQPFAGAPLGVERMARPHLLDLVAVRAVVTPQPTVPEQSPFGWRRVDTIRNLTLFENPHALPRAYVAHQVRFVPTEADALEGILSPARSVLEGVVLVGSPDDADPATRNAMLPVPIGPARFTRDDPEHLTIEVAPEWAGVLVVADAFAPGWSARVDGVPRRLWQANYLVRGVEVRPGDHVVEMTYDAPGFHTGLAVALGGWAIVAAIILLDRRRRVVSTG
ncbi:MAG TPA: hypothetical protein VGR62_25625 [Candidatus Binatia bacterium]|jgi:hypothetical protein|nr:hypothetical protein [Candidatus Binatia bacterium]